MDNTITLIHIKVYRYSGFLREMWSMIPNQFSVIILINIYCNQQQVAAIQPSTLDDTSCNCGKGYDENGLNKDGMRARIVNGYRPIHRPWMVFLRIFYIDDQPSRCGGALLNDKWIISAGHCFCERRVSKAIRCKFFKKNGRRVLRLLWAKKYDGPTKRVLAIFGINNIDFRHHYKTVKNEGKFKIKSK